MQLNWVALLLVLWLATTTTSQGTSRILRTCTAKYGATSDSLRPAPYITTPMAVGLFTFTAGAPSVGIGTLGFGFFDVNQNHCNGTFRVGLIHITGQPHIWSKITPFACVKSGNYFQEVSDFEIPPSTVSLLGSGQYLLAVVSKLPAGRTPSLLQTSVPDIGGSAVGSMTMTADQFNDPTVSFKLPTFSAATTVTTTAIFAYACLIGSRLPTETSTPVTTPSPTPTLSDTPIYVKKERPWWLIPVIAGGTLLCVCMCGVCLCLFVAGKKIRAKRQADYEAWEEEQKAIEMEPDAIDYTSLMKEIAAHDMNNAIANPPVKDSVQVDVEKDQANNEKGSKEKKKRTKAKAGPENSAAQDLTLPAASAPTEAKTIVAEPAVNASNGTVFDELFGPRTSPTGASGFGHFVVEETVPQHSTEAPFHMDAELDGPLPPTAAGQLQRQNTLPLFTDADRISVRVDRKDLSPKSRLRPSTDFDRPASVSLVAHAAFKKTGRFSVPVGGRNTTPRTRAGS